MKLASLLLKHDESTYPDGLINSLGDGFLLRQNQVYRIIRHKVLSLGFNYSNKVHEDYIALPMGQLENLIKDKTIPYTNNVSALKKINARCEQSLDWDHVVDNLKPNYIFHESCHVVARSFSFNETDKNIQILTMLVEESFANTCEFFAIAEAQDQTHRTFLEVNSYFTVFEDRTVLKKTIEKYGASRVFKFMLLCYLHSNFLNERLSDETLKKIINICDLESETLEIKTLKSLSQNAFALNPRFRFTTTEMYLRLKGLNTSVKQALDFDYLKLATTNNKINTMINQLTSILGDFYE